jgi:hypothetical protein
MILELDPDFSSVDLDALPSLYPGLETICLAVARGEHFLAANRATVERFVNDPNLTKVARGIFEWIKAEYSFLTSLFRQFSLKVRIKADASPPIKLSRSEWSVSIAHVADAGVRPTVLLGENSRDGDLYAEAAVHYRLVSKLNGTAVKVEPRNGNGGSTSAELERIDARKNEFCLCITDSDRFSPTVDLGDIGAACRRVAEQSNWVIFHDAPASRELENAIPHKLIEATARWAKMPGWDGFARVVDQLGHETIDYSDVKHGTTMNWVKSMPEQSPNRRFWEEKVQMRFGASINNFDCYNAGVCKSDTCKCVLVPAVGSELSLRVQEFMRLHGPHEILRHAAGSQNFGDWLRIGKFVLEAGIAPPRKRL